MVRIFKLVFCCDQNKIRTDDTSTCGSLGKRATTVPLSYLTSILLNLQMFWLFEYSLNDYFKESHIVAISPSNYAYTSEYFSV